MFQFSCPRCGRTFNAESIHLGKQIRCTGCSDIVTISLPNAYTSNQQVPVRNQPVTVDVKPPSLMREVQSTAKGKLALGIVGVALVIGICYTSYYLGGLHRSPTGQRALFPSKLIPDTRDEHRDDEPRTAIGAVPENSSQAESHRNDVFDKVGGNNAGSSPKTASSEPPLDKPLRKRGQTPVQLQPSEIDLSAGLQPLPAAPPTGTRLIPDEAVHGRGELEAFNGTLEDAYVVLVRSDTRTRVRQVYIRKHDRFTLEHLDPGKYQLLFGKGIGWDSERERFSVDGEYFSFGKPISFDEARVPGGVEYVHETITLNAVPHGNVRPVHISEEQFHSLIGKPLH